MSVDLAPNLGGVPVFADGVGDDNLIESLSYVCRDGLVRGLRRRLPARQGQCTSVNVQVRKESVAEQHVVMGESLWLGHVATLTEQSAAVVFRQDKVWLPLRIAINT